MNIQSFQTDGSKDYGISYNALQLLHRPILELGYAGLSVFSRRFSLLGFFFEILICGSDLGDTFWRAFRIFFHTMNVVEPMLGFIFVYMIISIFSISITAKSEAYAITVP